MAPATVDNRADTLRLSPPESSQIVSVASTPAISWVLKTVQKTVPEADNQIVMKLVDDSSLPVSGESR